MPHRYDFKFGNLTRTDGSALFACGDVALQAAVIGPGEISMHRECPDAAVIDVSLKRLTKVPDHETEQMEQFIKCIFNSAIRVELYPRSLIQLIVQELACESPLAAAINCINAALIDSGLQMKFAVIAVTCVVCEDESVCVGLNEECLTINRTSSQIAHGVLAFDSVNLHLISFCMKGKQLSLDKLNKCIVDGRAVANDLASDLRSAVTSALAEQ